MLSLLGKLFRSIGLLANAYFIHWDPVVLLFMVSLPHSIGGANGVYSQPPRTIIYSNRYLIRTLLFDVENVFLGVPHGCIQLHRGLERSSESDVETGCGRSLLGPWFTRWAILGSISFRNGRLSMRLLSRSLLPCHLGHLHGILPARSPTTQGVRLFHRQVWLRLLWHHHRRHPLQN